MTETFGKMLRNLRQAAGVGLRQLGRVIDKSPGYLSDVELDNVPPPSEEVIVRIAAALQVDKKDLLRVARKMDPELSNYIVQEPGAADFLRLAKAKEFGREDWERLAQLADFVRLGKLSKDRS